MPIKYKDEKHRTKVNGKRTFLYSCYLNMMLRCYNSKISYYHKYGGRGIKVEPHLQIWENFADHMYELLPEGQTMEDMQRLKMSINRINNDGNYERGNLEWETKKGQNLNRNIPENNSSGYLGVTFDQAAKKWKAKIRVDSKTINLGRFNLKKDAFAAVQKAYLKYHGPEAHAKMMERQRKHLEQR
jgi:hypothetical protein